MINYVNKYIKIWEERCYPGGLVDEADRSLENNCNVPSYRKITIALLKNDLSSLGKTGKYSKFYSELKRIEISQRPCKVKQLRLF